LCDLIIRYYTDNRNLIFPIYPVPEGRNENQFALYNRPIGAKKLAYTQIIKIRIKKVDISIA